MRLLFLLAPVFLCASPAPAAVSLARALPSRGVRPLPARLPYVPAPLARPPAAPRPPSLRTGLPRVLAPSPAPSAIRPTLPILALPTAAAPLEAQSARIALFKTQLARDSARESREPAPAEESSAAADRAFSLFLKLPGASAVLASDQAPAAFLGRETSRSLPLVQDVTVAPGISAEQRKLFQETLLRRKSAWLRGLAEAGLRLERAVAPKLRVLSAQAHAGKDAVPYGVSYDFIWEQGPNWAGRARLYIHLKDLTATVHRGRAPEAPAGKKLLLRFKPSSETNGKTVLDFLEANGLRLISKRQDGLYEAAVTGKTRPDVLARRLSGRGPLLHASAPDAPARASSRLRLWIKKSASPDELAAFWASAGLTVLKSEGQVYDAALPRAGSALKAARRLQGRGPVLTAAPVESRLGEKRQAVLEFLQNAEEGAIASFLRARKLRVLADLGGGALRVASWRRLSGERIAAALREDAAAAPILGAVHAVGSLPDDAIREAARGVIAYKGGIYSLSEYQNAYVATRDDLERRGASREQLERYAALCDQAPVRDGRFNRWSGD